MYTTTFKMIQVEIVKVHEMKILYFYIFYIFQSILYPTDIPEPTEAVIALSAHYCTTQTAKFSSSPLTTDRRAVNTCVGALVIVAGTRTYCAIFRAESRLKYARNLTVTDIFPLSAQETFDTTARLQMLTWTLDASLPLN